MEVAELETSSRRAPLFQFTPLRQSGRDVLEIEAVSKAYGAKQVLNVSMPARRGERVDHRFERPSGKSTLVKIATENLSEADAGG